MADTFNATELVGLFRSALVALLPVMDAARIRWAEPGVYDGWENIERALYASIVGSCVENAVPDAVAPLAAYGLTMPNYLALSFLSERGLRLGGTLNAFVELRTGDKPFDLALFHEVDASLTLTGRRISKSIDMCAFDLASPASGSTAYRSVITYED